MKHKKQGSLETASYSFSMNLETRKVTGDDLSRARLVEKNIGISGLIDFLNQSDGLSEQMQNYGSIAKDKSKTLRVLSKRLRKNIADGADRWLIYRSVHAALLFAELRQFKDESQKGKKITMAAYLAAKAISPRQVDIAKFLGVSTEAVRLFERKNHIERRKSR